MGTRTPLSSTSIHGAVMRTLRDLGGNDEVWFNPGDGHYFLAEGQLPLPAGQSSSGSSTPPANDRINSCRNRK